MWSALQNWLGKAQPPTQSPADTAKVHSDTGAVSVVPPVIKPLVSGTSEHDKIITPYRAEAFEDRLRRLKLLNKYPHLPGRIRNGFPMGDFAPLEKTYTSKNHALSIKHLNFIQDYVNEQVSLGRMTGPYSRHGVEDILGSCFMSSPLFVKDKAGSPGKYRLIQDYSYKNKDGFSVNGSIDPDDFPTAWGTAAEVAQIVATAPEGAQAASLDIDSAYRNIPILPDHKPYLVIQVNPGEFYIDHVCPFGVASGTGLHGQVMDATVDILERQGIKPLKKWVDDLVVFRFPKGKNSRGEWTFSHDVEDIFRLTRDLGVPWKFGKCFGFSDSVVYVGFLWNLRDRCVSLPEGKREGYKTKLDAFYDLAQASPVSQKDAMSILGVLCHVAFVYTIGRKYLTNLASFAAGLPSLDATGLVPATVKSDLKWWQGKLKVPSFSRSLAPRSTQVDPGVWVCTTSSWGIGIVIGGKRAAWKLSDQWKSEGRDVGWVDMVALELACRYLEVLKTSNADIVVHSDNRKVLRQFRKGQSRNGPISLSIRRIEMICTTSNLGIISQHVDRKDNLAEAASRGFIKGNKNRLPVLSSLPAELQPFLQLAQ